MGRVKGVKGYQAGIAATKSIGFDPGTEAIVESGGDGLLLDGLSVGNVRVVSYSAGKVELEADAEVRSLLVSSEAAYPGWRASLNGARAEVVLTNVAFLGVLAPAGRHRITLEYVPLSLGPH